MKKILFITTSISYGGAAKMLVFVAEHLAARGHQVSIANLQEAANDQRSVDRRIALYAIGRNGRAVGRLEQIRQLNTLAGKIKPDVIVSFKYTPNLLAAVVGKIRRIPVIISERGDPGASSASAHRLRAKLYWKIINSASGAVFQTEGAMKQYSTRLQKAGVVIPNPVFVPEGFTYNEGEKENSIVTFGRLANRQKRYDVMLDAFARFVQDHPDYVLKIYGNGPDEERITKWIEEKGLQGKALLMGLSKHPMQDIQKDKIFLITSDFEGISNSLLEAMAAGLPVVSTDSTPGGARMVIRQGEDGMLVPCGDAQAIAGALAAFADDEVLANQCAARARQVVDRFSPERIGNQWEEYVIGMMPNKEGRI